jgi:NADPH-dependent 2,4-dienoyl-CoA reductase/sulfur reductase-like enzyme
MVSVDVLVIGGGPAGMAAATAAANAGLSVALIDERADAGGQIYRGLENGPFGKANPFGDDYTKGLTIIERFHSASVATFFGASLWRVDTDQHGGTAAFSSGGLHLTLTFRRLIAATGAMERPVPFPGWTLPGVMNIGAAQLLMKSSGLVPSGRLALLGNGPLLLLFAEQLLSAGVKIDAILDTAPRINRIAVGLRHMEAMLRNRAKVVKGVTMLRTLRQIGARVYRNVSEVKAVGHEQLTALDFVSDGGSRQLPLDMLLVHEGVIPNIHLSQALGCKHAWNDSQGYFSPVTDDRGRSSNRNVFIVGDGAAIRGGDAAPASAEVAVGTILEDLERANARSRRALLSAQEVVQREQSFRPFLDALYPPRLATSPMADETVICRCEEVCASSLREAVRDGAIGPAQAKAYTRCGMGACQGRMCGLQVSQLIARETSTNPAEIGTYNVRFPLKPVTLADMAASAGNQASERKHGH